MQDYERKNLVLSYGYDRRSCCVGPEGKGRLAEIGLNCLSANQLVGTLRRC